MSKIYPVISAQVGLTKTPRFADEFTKYADVLQPPASTLKMMTSYVARKWIKDSMLDNTVTILAGDIVGGSSMGLLSGDVVSYRNLFYGMMLPSGNDAATAMARSVGGLINTDRGTATAPMTKFLEEMAFEATALGFSGNVFADSTGLSNDNRMSLRQLATVAQNIKDYDPFLLSVMGSLTRAATITGGRTTTLNINHTIDPDGPVKFPEFVAGKTGTISAAGACVVMIWSHPQGGNYISGVLNSSDTERFPDLRKIVDAAIFNYGKTDAFVIRDGQKFYITSRITRGTDTIVGG